MSDDINTGIPEPKLTDSRADKFLDTLDWNLYAKPTAEKESARDLDATLGDKAKAVGAGALGMVAGIGELADGVARHGEEYKDKTAWGNVASALSPAMKVISAGGDIAKSGSDKIIDSMTDDGKAALSSNIINETKVDGQTRYGFGDGAGDIDVWAMKFAHGIGSMIPTMAAGGITGLAAKQTIGKAVTASMIKRGASQEMADAVASKVVQRMATGSATTTAVTGSVGSAGMGAYDDVTSRSFDELFQHDQFKQEILKVDSNPELRHLSSIEKLTLAREALGEKASNATMGDAKTWAASTAGTLLGDSMIFKSLAGRGAKGIMSGAHKGAIGEAIGESIEEGGQQYATNLAVTDTTGIEIDPLSGVGSRAIEGGFIGAGTGSSMGALGGYRGGRIEKQAERARQAAEQSQEPGADQDPLQAAPDVASQPSVAAGQPMPTDSAQSEAVADAVAEALDPLAKAAPDLTKSGKAAPETGDSVTGTSGFDEFADVPAFLRNSPDRDKFASTDAQAQAFRDKFDPEREQGEARGTLDKRELRQPTDNSEMGVSGGQFDEFRDVPASRIRGVPDENTATQQVLSKKEAAESPEGWHPNVTKALAGEYGSEVRDMIAAQIKAGNQGATQTEQAARKPFDNKVDRELNQVAVYKPIEGEVIPAGTDKPSATQAVLPPSDLKADYTEIIPESRRIGKSDVIYANGEVSPGAEGNSAYVPPVLASNQPDTSMDTQSTRDPRSDVAKAIDRAGEEADSVFGPLKTMRITRRGKPFASQKEAQMASRKGIDTPVELNGGGYGVAEIAEVERAKAAKPEQAAEAQEAPPTAKVEENQTQTTPAADAGVSVSAVPWSDAIKNNDGTTTLIGDTAAIKSWVVQNGIKAIPRRGGMLVAKSASPKLEEIINQKTDAPAVSAEPAQAATPWRELIKNQDGTATLIGDPVTLKTWAKENGIRTITRKDGVMVAKSAVPKLDELAKPAAVKDIEAARTEVNVEPTEAQKEAGNYKKGHVKLQGLDITLENPKGSVRSGTDANGKAWQSTMAHDYGYIKRTEGADGDHVDAFIGDNPESQNVYVVDQRNADGTFDEHKVMLGFDDETSARAGYLANYSKGWKGLGDVRSMTMDEFKGWIKEGDTTRPAAEAAQASNDPDNAQEAPAAKAASYSRNDADASGSKEKATAKTNAKGMTKKEVELIAKGFVRQYKGAANILVTVVQTQEEANKLTFGGLPEGYKVHAFYQGDGIGRVVLVADNLTSAKHALQKMRHEVLVHHGFQAVIGDVEYGRILRVLWDARDNKSLKPLWDHVQDVERDTPLEGQLEELLAYVAERPRGAVGRFVDRIVGMVAQALRKVGFISKVTEAELRNIVEAIGDRMKAVSIYADKETDAEENRKNKNSNVLKGSMVKFSRARTAQDIALEKLNLGPRKDPIQALKSRIDEVKSRPVSEWKQMADDWMKRMNSATFDALAPLKYAEDKAGNIEASDSAYIAARLATGSSSTMHGAMLYGVPEWKDGIVQMKKGTTEKDAFLGIFESVGSDLHSFLGWIAGNRAKRLKAEGRENLLSDQDIDALIAGANGKEAKFEDARKRLMAMNDALLNMAEEAGLISKVDRQQWQDNDWYIPFYREDDGGDVMGPWTQKGLAGQRAMIKKLKGGKQNTNDLLENILVNASKLIDSSMKNMAMQKAVWNLAETDVIEVISKPNLMDMKAAMSPKGNKSLLSVKMEGEDYILRVHDDQLFKALTSIDQQRPDHPGLGMAKAAKRILTATVTAMPDFMLRNFIRDAMQAWTIDRHGFKFGIDSLRGIRKTWKAEGGTLDMLFAGGSFMGGYMNDTESMAGNIRRVMRKKGMTPEQIAQYERSIVTSAVEAKEKLFGAWEKYRSVGDAIENANREAVYDAAMRAGKSKAEAIFEAKDLMDFSMMGNARLMMYLSDILPFFNARMQGLSKLGRSIRDNPKLIAQRGGAIALASVALALLNADDERYEELPDNEKDLYWHVFLGDEHIRIPKPFEIGVLFGTVPERMTRTFITGNDSGKKLAERILWGVGETLSMNPVPQVVKPGMEVFFNYDMFRAAPIESMSDLNVKPEARYNENTSETLRAVGEATGMSPKKMEHLVRGYFGTMGMWVMGISDMVTRNVSSEYGDSPAWRQDDIAVVGSFFRGSAPAKSTQFMTEFYDVLQKAEQLNSTVRQYRQEGRNEEADDIMSDPDNLALLKRRKHLNNVQKQIRQLKAQIELVQRDRLLNEDEKRERIDRMMATRNKLVSQAVKITETAN
ncbi:hypothetical protein OQ486_09410 [Plesiomonas shigelloides]|uniref:LPD38 domain-containing protein n=1 Tax=Plesiomonas shigelloides TaxID=703 RepID=UPI0022454E84|nr:LPD38 domain-containing protein [Plesiomonas shigelloides]MCX2533693.1 hypothetical protein [Plesiomonas shigelloides]